MTRDGVFYSVMVGIGETYFPAFALAAGLGEVAAGLITTLPLLAGAVLQLFAPRGVKFLGSARLWVAASAALQATAFLPLVISAYYGGISLVAAFLVVSCYWGFGMATSAVWGTWVESLVPVTVRSKYFAKRTRYIQAGTLIGFLAGGFTLQYAKNHGFALQAFAALFAVAGICRLVSAWALTAHSEVISKDDVQRTVSVGELARRIWNGGSERFLVYLIAMQFAVYFSGPYFTPYMLRHLQLSYTTYVLLIGSCFVAKMLALPMWGKVAHRYGPQKLLWYGGLGIIPVSGLWMVSNSLPFLFALQIAGGIAWAAYELAMLLLFFETLRRDERTSLMSLYNAGNAASMVIGSIFGGLLINYFDKSPMSYLMVFMLSSVFRLMTVGILWTLPKLKSESTAAPAVATDVIKTNVLAERLPVATPAPAAVAAMASAAATASIPAVITAERRPTTVYAEDQRARKPDPQSTLAN